MNHYHHGKVIKEFREKCKMTQEKLAEIWPRDGGGTGVSIGFVQLVEAGKKHITSNYTLRKLCDILDIPHWRFGLSEYDPFNPIQNLPGYGKRMYDETLNVVEALIHQTLAMRRVAPLPEVKKSAQSLHEMFSYFLTYLPPTHQLEARFAHLYVQEQSIRGLMFFENNQYAQALATFDGMYRTAKQLGDPVLIVHALQKLGVELMRVQRLQEAMHALEEARDTSFSASRHVAAFANAYLGHIYAANGDALRFERAIHTAQSLAEPLKDTYGDGTDFVFQRMSGILVLRSRGYLRINEPQNTLALHDEVKRQVNSDANMWLDSRLHLYRARAYMMLHEVEASVLAGREFFRDVQDWQSPHRTQRAYELLAELENAGYGDVQVVRDFGHELREAMRQH
jgi:transcriptional regulator with XRE-family HTH domain